MQQHEDMGKFSISSYLFLAASCSLPILLPLMSNAVSKHPGLFPFPFECQIGEQLMNSFSLFKMVDRRQWIFSFLLFPSPCLYSPVAEGGVSSHVCLKERDGLSILGCTELT